jgi:hypothetical protein
MSGCHTEVVGVVIEIEIMWVTTYRHQARGTGERQG